MMNVYEANRIGGSNNDSGFIGWVEFLIFRFFSLEIRMIQQPELMQRAQINLIRQATATKIPMTTIEIDSITIKTHID
jgi:hypothetical protein